MNSQPISTVAFVGVLGALALYAFKLVTVKQAFLIGGGLLAVGFLTQPVVAPSGMLATKIY